MGFLIDILINSFTSLFWGILIAVACVALFATIVMGWLKNASFTAASYIVGIILLFFITIQCTLIVGSIKIINSTDEFELFVERIVDGVSQGWEEISKRDSEYIIDKVTEEYPLLSHYIAGGYFQGYNAQELPAAIADGIRTYMWWYIGRRLLWCLGFTVVAAFIGIKTLRRGGPAIGGASYRKGTTFTTNYSDDVF